MSAAGEHGSVFFVPEKNGPIEAISGLGDGDVPPVTRAGLEAALQSGSTIPADCAADTDTAPDPADRAALEQAYSENWDRNYAPSLHPEDDPGGFRLLGSVRAAILAGRAAQDAAGDGQ